MNTSLQSSSLSDIRSLTTQELEPRFTEWKEPAYRITQLLDWLYRKHATRWEEMSNLPNELRLRLSEYFDFHSLELSHLQGSRDTTQKFLWKLRDGALIESVLIPANPALYGDASDRHTLCVSTQVGCAYGCKFCASGLDGWKRNLTVDEIVEQVLAVERWNAASDNRPDKERLINNLVIMGMGEPLANYENLIKALTILNAPWGGNIGARKITVSTSGLAPEIERLANEPYQFRLAISLHGATDQVRERIMPINRRYPLERLMTACEEYKRRNGRKITFEYILIQGVNDSPDQTKPLAKLVHRLDAKINLIPYNKVDGLEWKRPSVEVQETFLSGLEDLGVTATLRREKGHDIDAACGQLRLRMEKG